MINAYGKIKSIAIDYTRLEPNQDLNLGVIDTGGQSEITVGIFTNKGNVPQTLTMLPFENLINCSKVSGSFKVDGVPTPNPEVVDLQPSESAYYIATVQVEENSFGSPDIDFSLDINWIWS